jgi:hypothetical protein
MALNKIEKHPSGSASSDRSNVDPTAPRPFPGSRGTHAIATAAVLTKGLAKPGTCGNQRLNDPGVDIDFDPDVGRLCARWGLRSLLSHNRREKARRYRQVPDQELEQ